MFISDAGVSFYQFSKILFIVSVAVATPMRRTFDYSSETSLAVGARVRISFNNRETIGVVMDNPKSSEYLDKLKPIIECLDEQAIIDPSVLAMLRWGAKYYHHPIGSVVLSALPKNLRIGKPCLIKKPIKISKQTQEIPNPNQAQIKVIDTVLSAQNDYGAFVLHGITGSGKTEVYIRISQDLIKQNKQVLILVPEIGLTPQMVKRFSTRIDTPVAVIHSQRNVTQKTDAYLLAQNNEVGIVLGTRSAIFTPMPNLGAIIIDEEHDGSFKQQSDWRYSARELAFVRARVQKVPLLLGSATPSLETLHAVIDKKAQYLTLKNRAGSALLPKVSLIDMTTQENPVLSGTLLREMASHLKAKKQVMLFINRRGYAPIFHCQNCNWQAKCESCSASMILHKPNYRLQCHHCAAEKMPPTQCPECDKKQLTVRGYGTQRLEELLYAHFPSTEIIRIDRDSTRKKKSMALYLEKIASNEPCIIIGTQMLAKGHDFLNLSLVGVLDADSSFFSTDFRSTEHLAQLLMQVSGRAGRTQETGSVYIQTKQPEHPIFAYIKQHDYLPYAKLLLKERKQAQLSPFGFQALICANSKEKQLAFNFLITLKDLLTQLEIHGVEIWGPVDAVIEKKADYYYVNLYLSSQERASLHQLLSGLFLNQSQLKSQAKVRWFLDINPV